MKTALKITYILPCLFIGLITGGAIFHNTSAIIAGVVLLVADIIIGITLQYIFDKRMPKDDWDKLNFEEKRQLSREIWEKSKQQMRDDGIDIDKMMQDFCDEFNREHGLGKYSQHTKNSEKVSEQEYKKAEAEEREFFENYFDDYNKKHKLVVEYASQQDFSNLSHDELCSKMKEIQLRVKADGGGRLVTHMNNDENILLLNAVCDKLECGPSKQMLYGIYCISAIEIGDAPAIKYSFIPRVKAFCEFVHIYLVYIGEELRIFTIEKSDSIHLWLCEYSGDSHINYGYFDEADILPKIQEIIEND